MAQLNTPATPEDAPLITRLIDRLDRIDRRVIYLFVMLSLSVPLIWPVTLPPARMATADALYQAVEQLKPSPHKLVLISADFGPGTRAENESQAAAAIEHLMRKRIPFALISIYQLAAPFLEKIPRDVAAKLAVELPGQQWEYGKDWVNLGYQPGGAVMIRGVAKAADIKTFLKSDARGVPLADIPCMQGVTTIKDIQMFMEFTGLVGVFSTWVQYFQSDAYRPPFVHGCTSITIPEAYIYFSSGQIVGLFEGVAGAAWYDKLLSDSFRGRTPGTALRTNTSLAVAHLIVIGFILLGNAGLVVKRLYA